MWTLEILLIRHGDPDYANDSLTPRGVIEARCLAEALKEVDIDGIYVSPLGRAQETCWYTAQAKRLEPVMLDWLRERGIKRGPVYLWEAPGEMFLQANVLPTLEDWRLLEGAMPEGDEQYRRVRSGFDELLCSYGYAREGHGYRVKRGSDKRIALFCHKGVILTLLGDILHWALPMVFVSLHIHPSGVTRLEMVERDGFAYLKALVINDLSHLGGALHAPPTRRPGKTDA
jgi:broad specificity phosphatase PhoE